ncbi:D-hexose-6-phosphate mutarotase [Actinotalea ferrariae]|uniref:D-hexose-6-phosphate mutarotase n=1 Tax=Actinotalea ferrariae TaxID=1386098 RepID=UPI001C8CEC91|nr:D-hexose-6-phosphate mutarotase [Actinotalea ferrariae]MBX9244870.1 D-hexose-6-phosphate mutarotase [Actinotalea ferrariae]
MSAPAGTLPPSVSHAVEGALPVIRVAGPAADAVVHLQGAQVTSWTPRGGAPVLWCSDRTRLEPGAAVRGGVPLCFPWFGAHPTDPSAPSHGFARVSTWQLLGAEEAGDEVVVRLGLSDDGATRVSAWPHRFSAVCTVTVGRQLTVALAVTNEDDVDVEVTQALHTYLAVRDVRTTSVTGLEGVPYRDKPSGGTEMPGSADPVRFDGETDRVYLGTTGTTVVDDGTRRLLVGKAGSATTVVWNPGPERGAALGDVGAAWPGFVCVEAANAGPDTVRLAPGRSHELSTTVAVER